MRKRAIANFVFIALFLSLLGTAGIIIALTLSRNADEIARLKNDLRQKEAEDSVHVALFEQRIEELESRLSDLTGQSAAVAKSVKAIEERPQVKQKSQDELVTAAVERVSPSVVSILKKKEGEKTEKGTGTGFIITTDGYILTNRHVISEKTAEYFVLFPNGEKLAAYIIFQDRDSDIAVLNVAGGRYRPAKLGDSKTLRLGQSVIAIGNALGEFDNSASVGIISGLGRTIEAEGRDGFIKLDNVIQTDTAINQGNSGGPLIDTDGVVVGVNVATVLNTNSISFSIPINTVKKVLRESPLKLSF